MKSNGEDIGSYDKTYTGGLLVCRTLWNKTAERKTQNKYQILTLEITPSKETNLTALV